MLNVNSPPAPDWDAPTLTVNVLSVVEVTPNTFVWTGSVIRGYVWLVA